MAKQITLQGVVDKINGAAEVAVKERLEKIANHAVDISPVDTGAYVESFSMVKAGQGGGRSRTSKGKLRQQNPEAKKQVAKEQLASDIAKFNIAEDLATGQTKYTLRNRAPHARIVEDGEGWKKRGGYNVFAEIRLLLSRGFN
jgi:hypothetical protein